MWGVTLTLNGEGVFVLPCSTPTKLKQSPRKVGSFESSPTMRGIALRLRFATLRANGESIQLWTIERPYRKALRWLELFGRVTVTGLIRGMKWENRT